jgi:hypothetical protein
MLVFCAMLQADHSSVLVEDTLDSAKSFRKEGKMVYVSDPDTEQDIVIGG